MTGQPLVSVGIPVYNGARFLPATLDALLAQTLTDLEIVISDNGSQDATEEVCRAYAARDPRIVYRRVEVNQGMGWNYNRTLELASAPLFMWNPADDLAKPGYLEACVDALRRRPDAVLAFSDVEVVDEDGALIESLSALGDDGSDPDESVRIRSFLEAEAWDVVYGVTRTDVLRAVGGMPPMVGDDVVLGVDLLARAPFVHVDGSLFQRRQHPEQSSAQHDPTAGQIQQDPTADPWFALSQWQINVELYRRVVRAPLPWRRRLAVARAVFGGWTYPTRRRLAGDLRRSVRTVARRARRTLSRRG
ncbi:glycosyltransferase family 2 protein [Mumia sp. DW29H23]|uniref:glycosyltransferase family 2 protein n=1 Tax=Mumia sp. DW29H23 TaxID=3421241 RepID=UPI003D68F92E